MDCIKCRCCGEIKSTENFYKNSSYKLGYDTLCKSCKSKYAKQYSKINKDKIKEYKKEYYSNPINRENHRLYNKQYNLKHKQTSLLYSDMSRKQQIDSKYSKLLNKILRFKNINNDLFPLSYDRESLRQHLESQFTPEMNWDNYGSYWEIDHIIPKNQFNYESIESKEFKICWSLLNLRPLESYKNRRRLRDSCLDIPENIKQKILNQKFD